MGYDELPLDRPPVGGRDLRAGDGLFLRYALVRPAVELDRPFCGSGGLALTGVILAVLLS